MRFQMDYRTGSERIVCNRLHLALQSFLPRLAVLATSGPPVAD